MKKIYIKIKKIISNPGYIYYKLGMYGFWKKTSDEVYLKRIYKILFNETLNLEQPKSFSEKIQWIKINDRNPLYTKMVDKYEAKLYVEEIMGNSDIIIPTLFVWEDVRNINFDKLPNQFVLKCTHDSGGLVVCKDKSTLNKKAALKKINKCLKRDFWSCCREWAYKNVPHRIIAEQYIQDGTNKSLTDYKFYCFNGKVKFFGIFKDRFEGKLNTAFFDTDFNFIPVDRGYGISDPKHFNKPENMTEMIKIAEKLSKGFKFLRVDLYNCEGKIYFGELTFYPNAGLGVTKPKEIDLLWGSYIKLPCDK